MTPPAHVRAGAATVPDRTCPPPLTGLRVVSTANALPAAIVGQVLADYGAEVVLLEPPAGSRLRNHAAWGYWSRGQHSVIVDLSDAGEQERARRLLGRSDVFVDGWGSGVAARLGLAPEILEARNPRLIQVRISAFGDDSPLAGLKGWESVVMARTGGSTSFANLSPRPGPSFVSTPYCSVSAAHLALQGALGALVERERSGRGQRVSTSLVQGLLAFDTWNWLIHVLALRHASAFELEPAFDPKNLVPNTPFFFRLLVGLAKDGKWLQFSQTTERLWRAFLRACGLDPDDPGVQQSAVSEDPAVRVRFWETLLRAVRSRTAAEWRAVFDADPDVWAEEFRNERTALEHPQLLADHRVAKGPDGRLTPGALAQGSIWPAFAPSPGPLLGAGTGRLVDEPAEARSTPAAAGSEPALAGVTILELGTFYAAPYGATLLAEQGARVIKIEPAEGDPIRNVVGIPDLGGIKVLHGKESIVADLATPEGQEVLAKLTRNADVVLQSYRAGVAERLRCTAADLLAINPDLVYVSSPGYGDGPPCGHRPAFAPTIGAASGLAVRNAGGWSAVPDGPDLDETTVKRTAAKLSSAAMGMGNADGFAALGVGTAILLGLLGRRRFGGGNVMRASMLSTMTHALGDWLMAGPGARAAAPDEELMGVGPLHRLYETAQGWVMLVAQSERERTALAAATSVDLADAGFGAKLEAAFLAEPAARWQQRLLADGVTCVEVSPQGVEKTMMLGPLGTELGVVTTAWHPAMQEYPRPSALTTYSRSRSVLGPAPLLGEQTEAIQAELEEADR
jgi:crotonobetainyl-CoA:carnitine CoA-transferase CaiB-like acyl-CoA transferase